MIIFMIYEPLGMARLWETLKHNIRSKLTSLNITSLKSSKLKNPKK